VTGSTGAVLHRSLVRLTALIGRALEEVRLTRGVQHVERLSVSGFIEEVAAAAALDTGTKGLTLTVVPVEEAVAVEGDRQVLAAALHNLLQNAFKFTRPGSLVTLRVKADAARVMIEVEDECGGLPAHDAAGLFRPFEAAQRGSNGSGTWSGLQPVGRPKRTVVCCRPVTCRAGDACSPSICPGAQARPSTRVCDGSQETRRSGVAVLEEQHPPELLISCSNPGATPTAVRGRRGSHLHLAAGQIPTGVPNVGPTRRSRSPRCRDSRC